MTSQRACHYADVIGLSEKLTFYTDASRKNVNSFSHDVLDLQYLATLEKTAKKRRLMTETQFEAWTTQVALSFPEEGNRPNFSVNQNKQYAATGAEKVVKKTPEQAAEE